MLPITPKRPAATPLLPFPLPGFLWTRCEQIYRSILRRSSAAPSPLTREAAQAPVAQRRSIRAISSGPSSTSPQTSRDVSSTTADAGASKLATASAGSAARLRDINRSCLLFPALSWSRRAPNSTSNTEPSPLRPPIDVSSDLARHHDHVLPACVFPSSGPAVRATHRSEYSSEAT